MNTEKIFWQTITVLACLCALALVVNILLLDIRLADCTAQFGSMRKTELQACVLCHLKKRGGNDLPALPLCNEINSGSVQALRLDA